MKEQLQHKEIGGLDIFDDYEIHKPSLFLRPIRNHMNFDFMQKYRSRIYFNIENNTKVTISKFGIMVEHQGQITFTGCEDVRIDDLVCKLVIEHPDTKTLYTFDFDGEFSI